MKISTHTGTYIGPRDASALAAIVENIELDDDTGIGTIELKSDYLAATLRIMGVSADG